MATRNASVPGPWSGLRSLGLGAALTGRVALQRADETLARLVPKDAPGLLVFVFHCVFASESEAESGIVDPHERATTAGLARLISHFRGHGYRFVSSREIDAGLPAGGRYAHLTFDDGFANNLHLVDLLQREEAHATVFPSINHLREGKAFWWNVVYRERHRRGQGRSITAEYAQLRRIGAAEVDRHLLAEFGTQALKPTGDVDRPLTVPELRRLASSPWIEIGNHTLDHTVLTHCTLEEAAAQIGGAQRWLQDLLGEAPTVIAYPNGDVDDSVARMASDQGLRLGVTVAPGRNRLPVSNELRMRLRRMRIVFDRRQEARMRVARSPVQLAAAARGMVLGRG